MGNLSIGISIESYEEYLNSMNIIHNHNYGIFGTDFVFHIIVWIFPYKDLENLLMTRPL